MYVCACVCVSFIYKLLFPAIWIALDKIENTVFLVPPQEVSQALDQDTQESGVSGDLSTVTLPALCLSIHGSQGGISSVVTSMDGLIAVSLDRLSSLSWHLRRGKAVKRWHILNFPSPWQTQLTTTLYEK